MKDHGPITADQSQEGLTRPLCVSAVGAIGENFRYLPICAKRGGSHDRALRCCGAVSTLMARRRLMAMDRRTPGTRDEAMSP